MREVTREQKSQEGRWKRRGMWVFVVKKRKEKETKRKGETDEGRKEERKKGREERERCEV